MSNTLHLKITLVGSKPPIWRKFQLTDDFRFDRFHQLIQLVMGWENAHLHDFAFTDRRIGMLFDDMWGADTLEDETKVYLRDVPLKKGDRFVDWHRKHPRAKSSPWHRI